MAITVYTDTIKADCIKELAEKGYSEFEQLVICARANKGADIADLNGDKLTIEEMLAMKQVSLRAMVSTFAPGDWVGKADQITLVAVMLGIISTGYVRSRFAADSIMGVDDEGRSGPMSISNYAKVAIFGLPRMPRSTAKALVGFPNPSSGKFPTTLIGASRCFSEEFVEWSRNSSLTDVTTHRKIYDLRPGADTLAKDDKPDTNANEGSDQDAGGESESSPEAQTKLGAITAALKAIGSPLASDAEEVLEAFRVRSVRIAKLRSTVNELREEVDSAGSSFTGAEVEHDADAGTVKICGSDFPVVDETLRKKETKHVFEAFRSFVDVGTKKVEFALDDVVKVIQSGKIPLLWGPPGCGKTTSLIEAFAAMGWKSSRFPAHKSVDAGHFLGEWALVNGETVYVHGMLPKAMKAGHLLILDEGFRLPTDCTAVLHGVMEGEPLVIASNHGEIVEPHANFRMCITDNTRGHGDMTGEHPDAVFQDRALMSRIACTFEVDYPERDKEVEIVASHGLKASEARKLVDFARDTRGEDSEIQRAIDMRQLIHCAEVASVLDLKRAFAATIIGSCSDDDAAKAFEIGQRHLGNLID